MFENSFFYSTSVVAASANFFYKQAQVQLLTLLLRIGADYPKFHRSSEI